MSEAPEWFKKAMTEAIRADRMAALPWYQRHIIKAMYWLDKRGWLPEWAGGGHV